MASENIIEEKKQGQALITHNIEGNKKKLFIESYGCQMNLNDSEIVASILAKEGFNTTHLLEEADLVLVNTCSIREKAEQTIRKRLQKYNRVKRINPEMKIGVLGCMAERLKTKFLEEEKMVDLDTSGEGAEIKLEEQKDESVVDTEAPKQEETKQEEVKEEPKEELSEGTKPEETKNEEKLEDYSKGVQARIAKLTRKMREAERREKAALDYAKAVESKRQTLDSKFGQVNKDYVTQFEKRVKDGMSLALLYFNQSLSKNSYFLQRKAKVNKSFAFFLSSCPNLKNKTMRNNNACQRLPLFRH